MVSSLNDPVNSALPQPPLSRILFPCLSGMNRCKWLGNPEVIEIEGIKILFLDGHIIRDYSR